MLEQRGSTACRGDHITGCWNRGVPLHTEVTTLQGVGTEGFHCMQRRPHYRVLEQRGSTAYRGDHITGCWNRGVPLYTEVTTLQGVRTEGFHCTVSCDQSNLFVSCVYINSCAARPPCCHAHLFVCVENSVEEELRKPNTQHS